MAALTNHRDLMRAYNKGELERVAKDLNLYQTIESDREWVADEKFCRRKTYLVGHAKGVARWTVKQMNGDVCSVACEFNIL